MSYLNVTIAVKVQDPAALFAAALAHAMKVDEMSEADARALLFDAEEGEPDLNACLTMLFDPGVSPDGCEIQDTTVEADAFGDDADPFL